MEGEKKRCIVCGRKLKYADEDIGDVKYGNVFLPNIKTIDFIMDELNLKNPLYENIKADLSTNYNRNLAKYNNHTGDYSLLNTALKSMYCSFNCFQKQYKLAKKEAKKHVHKQKKTEFDDEELPMSVIRKKLKEEYGQCRVCGDDQSVEAHHIIPKEFGGKDTMGNVVPLCPTCHNLAHGKGVLTNG